MISKGKHWIHLGDVGNKHLEVLVVVNYISNWHELADKLRKSGVKGISIVCLGVSLSSERCIATLEVSISTELDLEECKAKLEEMLDEAEETYKELNY